jgi:hypothetical protein
VEGETIKMHLQWVRYIEFKRNKGEHEVVAELEALLDLIMRWRDAKVTARHFLCTCIASSEAFAHHFCWTILASNTPYVLIHIYTSPSTLKHTLTHLYTELHSGRGAWYGTSGSDERSNCTQNSIHACILTRIATRRWCEDSRA